MSYFLAYLYMYLDVCEGGTRDIWNGAVYEDDALTGYTQNIDGKYTSLIQNNLVLPTDQTY